MAVKNFDLIDKITNMNEEEWQNFRIESWKKKKANLPSEVPSWYLENKENYISFISKNNAKLMKLQHKPVITAEEIKSMSEAQWQNYRKEMWAKKQAKFAENLPPSWYLGDKNKYLNFLKKNL